MDAHLRDYECDRRIKFAALAMLAAAATTMAEGWEAQRYRRSKDNEELAFRASRGKRS